MGPQLCEDKAAPAYSRWRWLAGAVLLLGIFGESLLWSAPAPLLTVIIGDLNVSLSAGGMLVSVIYLMITGLGLAFDRLRRYVSARELFTAGLLLMAAGQMLLVLSRGYGGALLLRLLAGVGMGLTMPVYAVLVMKNFPERERPIVNTIYAALPYVASALCFTVTVPLYYACGSSWRWAMFAIGAAVLAVALLWWALRRHIRTPRPGEAEETGSTRGLLRQVIGDKQVRLLAIADICDLWGYNFLASFLPTYFTAECGMELAAASRLSAVFSVTGIAAGLLCGLWMSRVGLRKPFTWPMHLLIWLGTLLMAFGQGWLRVLGLVLAGFGNAGWAPALFTMAMEFKGMTPVKAGLAYSFIFSLGNVAAFISPLLGGWIGDQWSLRAALVIFSCAGLVAAVATYNMDETGVRRKLSHGVG